MKIWREWSDGERRLLISMTQHEAFELQIHIPTAGNVVSNSVEKACIDFWKVK